MKKPKSKRNPKPVNKQNWEELESIYLTMCTGVVSVSNELNSAIRLIKLSGLPVTDDVTDAITTITKDITTYTNDLADIHNSHIGKTGRVRDGDDLTKCLTVFNDYVLLNDRFSAITMMPLLTISDFLGQMRLQDQEESHD